MDSGTTLELEVYNIFLAYTGRYCYVYQESGMDMRNVRALTKKKGNMDTEGD